jgi:hypothetical protein
VSASAVPAIEAACVVSVQLAHPEREIWQRGLDDRVVMAAHEAVRMAEPAVAINRVIEVQKEALAVKVVAEDRPACISSSDDVVDAAGEAEAKGPGHPSRVGLLKRIGCGGDGVLHSRHTALGGFAGRPRQCKT